MSQDQPTALQFAISSFNETYFPTINREQFTQKNPLNITILNIKN